MSGPQAMILTYHSISEGGPPLCVSPSRFEAQLDLLEGAGLRAVPLGTLVDCLESNRLPSHTSFALTFDDAYLDFRECALPILEEQPPLRNATTSQAESVLPSYPSTS
jgi:peptidoglycan/xylan/chitin deacetylase (PgdA/CDA1 family)